MWAARETATQGRVLTPPAGLQTCRDPVSHPKHWPSSCLSFPVKLFVR